MSRPIHLGSGAWAIPNPHQLALKLARGLEEQGEFFFSRQELMDAFGLAYEPKDTYTAIDCLLTFTKELVPLECHLKNIGFVEIDRAALIFAMCYTVESKKHDNDPLWVREVFELERPILTLVNEFASMWVTAVERRPLKDIQAIARGE